jgi:hypothetical protein
VEPAPAAPVEPAPVTPTPHGDDTSSTSD